jgi:membrane protein implicated in regulation of membrane protease activity
MLQPHPFAIITMMTLTVVGSGLAAVEQWKLALFLWPVVIVSLAAIALMVFWPAMWRWVERTRGRGPEEQHGNSESADKAGNGVAGSGSDP